MNHLTTMHHYYCFTDIIRSFSASVMSDHCIFLTEGANSGSAYFIEGRICGMNYECNSVWHFLCVGVAVSCDVDNDLVESMNARIPLHF